MMYYHLEYPSLPIERMLFIDSTKHSWSFAQKTDCKHSSESIELSNDLLLSVCCNKAKLLCLELWWIENNTPDLIDVVGWLWWELPTQDGEGASQILKISNNVWLQQYFSTHEQYIFRRIRTFGYQISKL